LKGREGFGFLSLSRQACEAGFGAFEKMKCIFFYCTGGKFGEVVGTHRTLAAEASDAGLASGVLLVSGASKNFASDHPTGGHQTQSEHCFCV